MTGAGAKTHRATTPPRTGGGGESVSNRLRDALAEVERLRRRVQDAEELAVGCWFDAHQGAFEAALARPTVGRRAKS